MLDFVQLLLKRRAKILGEVPASVTNGAKGRAYSRLATLDIHHSGVRTDDRTLVADTFHTRADLEIDSIDRALVRLRQGSYGLCLVCGDLLPLGLLEAQPWAETCGACRRSA